jgi:hypothetical protein
MSEAPRYFFHSFPRPKPGETEAQLYDRAIAILRLMGRSGLVLAPEVVRWDATAISANGEQVEILQRRASFTELSVPELPRHTQTFGPIALAFDIGTLRSDGAIPVIYSPQGLGENPISHLGVFVVRAAWHTRAVLQHLEQLRLASDPVAVEAQYKMPVSPAYSVTLQNSDKDGRIVASTEVPASIVKSVFDHVGFNNIPFSHSVGALSIFLNMFYPTDNEFNGVELDYYRQREWRLVAGDFNLNERPVGRELSKEEKRELVAIDRRFWGRELHYRGEKKRRVDWALVYDPSPNWSLIERAVAIYVPQALFDQARDLAGDKVLVI